ncbi:MAG: hypothetical protein WC389_03560 [Lutibacter sp.]|jgi:hypothetical protein
MTKTKFFDFTKKSILHKNIKNIWNNTKDGNNLNSVKPVATGRRLFKYLQSILRVIK